MKPLLKNGTLVKIIKTGRLVLIKSTCWERYTGHTHIDGYSLIDAFDKKEIWSSRELGFSSRGTGETVTYYEWEVELPTEEEHDTYWLKVLRES